MRMHQRQQQAQVGLWGSPGMVPELLLPSGSLLVTAGPGVQTWLKKGWPNGTGSCLASTSTLEGQFTHLDFSLVHCLGCRVLLTGTLAELLYPLPKTHSARPAGLLLLQAAKARFQALHWSLQGSQLNNIRQGLTWKLPWHSAAWCR